MTPANAHQSPPLKTQLVANLFVVRTPVRFPLEGRATHSLHTYTLPILGDDDLQVSVSPRLLDEQLRLRPDLRA